MQPRERAAAPRSYAVTAVLCVLLTAFSSPSLIGAASSVTMTVQHLEIHSVNKYMHARGDSIACAQRCQHERWQSRTSALRVPRPGLPGGVLCVGRVLRGQDRHARRAAAQPGAVGPGRRACRLAVLRAALHTGAPPPPPLTFVSARPGRSGQQSPGRSYAEGERSGGYSRLVPSHVGGPARRCCLRSAATSGRPAPRRASGCSWPACPRRGAVLRSAWCAPRRMPRTRI